MHMQPYGCKTHGKVEIVGRVTAEAQQGALNHTISRQTAGASINSVTQCPFINLLRHNLAQVSLKLHWHWVPVSTGVAAVPLRATKVSRREPLPYHAFVYILNRGVTGRGPKLAVRMRSFTHNKRGIRNACIVVLFPSFRLR